MFQPLLKLVLAIASLLLLAQIFGLANFPIADALKGSFEARFLVPFSAFLIAYGWYTCGANWKKYQHRNQAWIMGLFGEPLALVMLLSGCFLMWKALLRWLSDY